MKALDFPCPYCTATKGARCSQLSGAYPPGARVELPYYHAERVDAALSALQADGVLLADAINERLVKIVELITSFAGQP